MYLYKKTLQIYLFMTCNNIVVLSNTTKIYTINVSDRQCEGWNGRKKKQK